MSGSGTGAATGSTSGFKGNARGTGTRKSSDAPGTSAGNKKPAPKPAPGVGRTGGTRENTMGGEASAGARAPEGRAGGGVAAPEEHTGDGAGGGARAPGGGAYGTGGGARAPRGSAVDGEEGAGAPEDGAGAPGGGGDGGVDAPGGGAGAPGGGAGAPGGGGWPGAPGGGGGAGGGGGGGPGGPGGPAVPPPPLSAVGMALSVCGANPFEIYALEYTERLNTIQAFGRMTSDDVTQLAARLEKRPYPYNVSIPTSVVKNIQGLCFWAARARRQGRHINYGEFNVVALAEALDAMEIQAEKTSSPDIKPPSLKEENWEEWAQEFQTYLSHIPGKQKAPLDYVIRPDLEPTHVFASTREEDLYSYPLGGPTFVKTIGKSFVFSVIW